MSTTIVYCQLVKIEHHVEDVITLNEEGNIIKIESYIDDIITFDDQSAQYIDDDGNIMIEPCSHDQFSSSEDNLESEWWVSFFIHNTTWEIRHHLRGITSS